MATQLRQAYEQLFAAFGPQQWWPGESQFEIVVGTVLTQNTAWRNVERAIANLRDADALELTSLLKLHDEELAELIRPAGYYRLKARRLRNLLEFVQRHYDGSLTKMFDTPLDLLRSQLLEINGIGPETADSILLYAGQQLTFVVDAYTARIAFRHGWIDEAADYHAIQEQFQGALQADVQLYNEMHALIVRTGKEYCHKRAPDCAPCPLRNLLPTNGPQLSSE